MLKFENLEYDDLKNGPFSENVSLIFSDSDLDKNDIKFVESKIKQFFPIVVRLNPEKTFVYEEKNLIYLKITVNIPDQSENKIQKIKDVQSNFIKHYENVVIPNLKK